MLSSYSESVSETLTSKIIFVDALLTASHATVALNGAAVGTAAVRTVMSLTLMALLTLTINVNEPVNVSRPLTLTGTTLIGCKFSLWTYGGPPLVHHGARNSLRRPLADRPTRVPRPAPLAHQTSQLAPPASRPASATAVRQPRYMNIGSWAWGLGYKQHPQSSRN